ncbi:hypothetical protein [Aliivibrio fischeri]|uniref:hypothetical protein n=1 Tax=Aliivibrio fischeri TaxID=668 RepID=UPI0012DA4DE3|nr:hypothetical protein [Aliivibrio fischeri]MUK65319.1 hypothetical protein [Aliivibrio fischeri]
MKTIVVDIKSKIKKNKIPEFNKNDSYISLNSYSSYLLESQNINFMTYHDILNEKEYCQSILNIYNEIENDEVFVNSQCKYYLRDAAKYITLNSYILYIEEWLKNKDCDYIRCSKSSISNLEQYIQFNNVTVVDNIDKSFYLEKKIGVFLGSIRSGLVKKLKSRFSRKLSKFSYESKSYYSLFSSIPVSNHCEFALDSSLYEDIIKKFVTNNKMRTVAMKEFASTQPYSTSPFYIPFTFLNGRENYFRFQLYQKLGLPIIIFQHGSYVHENYFLKYNEITSSDLNIVFNEYTKELFYERNAKDVVKIKPLLFNKKINKKNKKYDFLYISYCTQYAMSGMYVSSEDSIISADANNIFKRHSEIIKLFGEVFVNKKICIKIQPGIHLGSMNYIPLVELAEKYDNVTIESGDKLDFLFSVSDNVISDYYSTEFLNYNLILEKNISIFTDIIAMKGIVKDELSEFLFLLQDMNELKNWIVHCEGNVNKKKDVGIIKRYTRDEVNSFSILSKKIEQLNERD